MFNKAKEFRVQLGDTYVDCISFGRGTRPLVMLQGLNTRGIKGSAAMLAYMYRIFAKDFKVYLFDRRADIREGLSVRELAGDVAEAMDALGISSADIFGVSQGGMIGQYLALDRPELVNKLVLAVTLSRNNDTVVSVLHNWIALSEQGAMRELVADMAEKMYSEEYMRRYKAFLPLLTALQKPRDVERFIILAKSCLSCDTYDELDRIQCPVFVLGGKRDKVLSGAASEEMAAKLGCKIYMYDELGHAAYEEAKDFNKKVYDFLME